MGGRHTVRALSQEVWSVWTGGRKPSGRVPSPGNLRAISGTGQRRLPTELIDGSQRAD